MSLAAINVSVRLGPARAPREVLAGVSAPFAPGRLCAVLGPNGSGKTTLLRTLLGVLPPASGRVELDGQPVAGLSPRQRARRIGYVPQRPGLAAPVTVAQYIALGRFAAGNEPQDQSAAVQRAARTVGLADRQHDRVDELSAGQAQRATLARVLAQLDDDGPEPHPGTRALLADEPTAALDPAHAIEAMRLLRGQARRGLAVVVALHDATLALRYADDALLLDARGAVAALGPAHATLSAAALQAVFGVPFVRDDGPARALLPAPEPHGPTDPDAH